jgi:hypothetical protein
MQPRRPYLPWVVRVRRLSQSPGNGVPLRQAGPARARAHCARDSGVCGGVSRAAKSRSRSTSSTSRDAAVGSLASSTVVRADFSYGFDQHDGTYRMFGKTHNDVILTIAQIKAEFTGYEAYAWAAYRATAWRPRRRT